MKRAGHIYEQMADWSNIVEAEKISTKRKSRNTGVRHHVKKRWQNLIEIQNMVLENRMRTDRYQHEQRISGQDKMRDIAKLKFHPSHIEHQLITMAGDRRIDRCLIRHTYASRKGYGQTACALHLKKVIAKYRGQVRWYGQGDICKYYDSIPHDHIRHSLENIFKDEKFINAFIEPFERFTDNTGIPLGIRPSQSIGNLSLTSFDHYMTEQVGAEDFTRYLDDFFFTAETKGEANRVMRRAIKYLNDEGFTLHTPKIHRISEGVDMMGYVYYGSRNDMYLRKTDKKRWLKRRQRVSNPRRLRELDDAAWGMLKWGGKHCHRLFTLKTGRDMGVKYKDCGIKRTERLDSNGVPFIDGKKISMGVILGKPVECDKWVGGVKTSQGPGRYAMRILFMGEWYKLIVNAVDIKTFLQDLEKSNVTRFKTVFIDLGSLHYALDETQTEILEVGGRKVFEKDGKVLFEDNKEVVNF